MQGLADSHPETLTAVFWVTAALVAVSALALLWRSQRPSRKRVAVHLTVAAVALLLGLYGHMWVESNDLELLTS